MLSERAIPSQHADETNQGFRESLNESTDNIIIVLDMRVVSTTLNEGQLQILVGVETCLQRY